MDAERTGLALLPPLALAVWLSVLQPDQQKQQQPPADDNAEVDIVNEPAPGSDTPLANVRPVLELIGDALGAPTEPKKSDARTCCNARAKQSNADDVAKDEARFADVWRRGHAQRVAVRLYVATLPDYVDSQVAWRADSVLGAIQSAMGTAGFALDRFVLIERTERGTGEKKAATAKTRDHEVQPGAVIFRRYDVSTGVNFVVVLLVLETPTGGVHRTSLGNAIAFIHRWLKQGSEPLNLRIIGPTFSGSVHSLAAGLAEHAGKFDHIRVVSGGAIADNNEPTMRKVAGAFGKRLVYRTTTLTSSELEIGLQQFLAKRFRGSLWPSGWQPTPTPFAGMGWLVESNTAYGIAPDSETMEQQRDSGMRSLTRCTDAPAVGDTHDTEAGMSRRVAAFGFPLHVSQLRSDSKGGQPKFAPLLANPAAPLNLSEAGSPTDQIPSLAPQLAAPTVGTLVHGMLDYMRRERFGAMGIIATDERDVLFLSRELKLALPDLQLVLFAAHSLYLHPEYTPYTRGALVVSAYPLSPAFQAGPGAENGAIGYPRGAHLFVSMAAQGVYNATLDQLGRRDLSIECAAQEPPEPANAMDAKACRPSVWVSVIGNDAFWPLMREELPPQEPRQANARASLPTRPLQPAPSGARVAASVLSAFLLLHVCAAVFVMRRAGSEQRLAHAMRFPVAWMLAPPASHREVVGRHRLAVKVLFSMIALIAAATALTVWFQLAGEFEWRADPLLGGAAALGAGAIPAIAGLRLLKASRSAQTNAPDFAFPAEHHSWISIVVMLSAIAGTGVTLLVFLIHLGRLGVHAPADAKFWVARVVSGGFVSPAFPVLALAFAVYVVILSGLRRMSMVGKSYTWLADQSPLFRLLAAAPAASPMTTYRCIPEPETALDAAPSTAEAHAVAGDYRHFVGMLDMPGQNLPPVYTVAIAASLGVCWWMLGGVHTIDGPWFALMLTLGSISCLAFGLLLAAQAFEMWRLLRQKLRRLCKTPLQPVFSSVGDSLRWDLSLAPTRSIELLPVAHMVEQLRVQTVLNAQAHLRSLGISELDRRWPPRTAMMAALFEALLAVRKDELSAVIRTLEEAPDVKRVTADVECAKFQPLLQNESWLGAWALGDRLTPLLEGAWWSRHPTATGPGSATTLRGEWFAIAEKIVAIQIGFVLRDVMARMMWALFTAMLCLTSVTAAHLFYSFDGRATFLRIDMFAIAVTASVALWVLVGVERDTVISALRHTKPGRIDFNWNFVSRIAIYGVLPVLVVMASIFPEIGNPLLGWLEPVRNIISP